MTAGLFRAVLRHDRAVVLGSLAVVVLLAWIYLVFAADTGMKMMDMGGGQMMAMRPEWTLGYGLVIFVMWAVMMVAMMLPSAAPVTLLVSSVAQKRAAAGGAAHGNTTLFVFGYLAVWLAFAAAATILQWALDKAGLLSGMMAVGNIVLVGSVLVAAGVYQWTPLKEACLRHCRSPLDFLLFHWRDGARGAVSSGIGHGLYCLGCCWMLMALLFVGGVMNLVWIAGIALLVLLEKTMPWGRWVSRMTGVVLVAWGAVILATVASP
jgi:predicted metal-binding membrane protein